MHSYNYLCGSRLMASQGGFMNVLSDKAKGPRSSPGRKTGIFAAYPFPNDSQDLRRAPTPGIQYQDNATRGEKQIAAEVPILAPIEEVWAILTNYESLPTFIPNLEKCERLPSTEPQTVFLKQVGCSQGMLWRVEAQAILCVQEVKLSSWRREVWFRMIEGDFEEFFGRWIVESDLSSSAKLSTYLRYEATVIPRFKLPNKMISYIVRAGLPMNIQAIAMKAEELASARLRASGLASWAGIEEDPSIPISGRQMPSESDQVNEWLANQMPMSEISGYESQEMSIPAKAPFWPLGSPYSAAAPITSRIQARKARRDAAKSSYLGIAWVPLPTSGTPEPVKDVLNRQVRSKEDNVIVPGSFQPFLDGLEKFDMATLPYSEQTRDYPAFPGIEIHLRRLDGLEYLHRRVVASIHIDAPCSSVWGVITDYDNLANFIPNLASSERIRLPISAPKNIFRVRQVGYKSMSYLCLHAESVMDLVEKEHRYARLDCFCFSMIRDWKMHDKRTYLLRVRVRSEIQFRQVAGDFDKFQGKWIVQEGPQGISSYGTQLGPLTILKYAVEVVIPKSACLRFVLEPIFERVVFEDLSRNLFAIKNEVERQFLGNGYGLFRYMSDDREMNKPKLSEMIASFDVFRIEMNRLFGDKQVIPSRSELRRSNRSDIEKAISAHGGPAVVAQRLGWRSKGLYRKPKGYWNSIDNVKKEIDEFISIYELPIGTMPIKNDFIRANRFDLARAIERWGGLYCLAEQLGYKVATTSIASSFTLQTDVSDFPETNVNQFPGSSNESEMEQITGESQNTQMRIDEKVVASRQKSFPSARDEIDAW